MVKTLSTVQAGGDQKRMALSLGEKLRQAREERGISISEVAEQTRISPLYLKSIEKDDYKPLPGGIFNKGFVRSYARYIGFDEEEALRDYAEMMSSGEIGADSEPQVYHPEVLSDGPSLRSLMPLVIFGAVILILVVGGIALLVNYFSNRPAANSAANSSPAANSAGPTPAQSPETVLPTGVPAMGTVRIEFSTAGEDVSLNAFLDGAEMNPTVLPGKPVVFEPKQSLRVRYSKYRAPSVRMSINGKDISLPQSPANPKREPIEFDITSDNLQRVWQAGEIRFASQAQPATAVTPRPRPSPNANSSAAGRPAVRPSLPPVNAPVTRRTPQ